MNDDLTPTDPQPTDIFFAQIAEFERNPRDLPLFTELRERLRKAGQAARLAHVCELRAEHESDPVRAAAILAEAGEAWLHVGDEERGEGALRRALARDPGNERAAARLSERLMALGRYAEAADVLEAELAALERRADDGKKGAFSSRRAHRHRVLGQLWDVHLGRLDRALHHWQRAWQLEPERPEAIEAARAIYLSLGDERMVARLYELELEAIGERAPRDRRAHLFRELGLLLARRGDAEGAIERLEEALRLAPDDVETMEALAQRYAPRSETAGRAVELYLALGRRRWETGDPEGAIGYYRRALGVDPRSDAAAAALEEALRQGGRYEELERHYRMRSELALDEAERAQILVRRSSVLLERLEDRAEAKRCYAELAAREPPGGPASRKLRELYAADGDWEPLLALCERELERPDVAPKARAEELLRMATIAREHLGDRDRAAEYLHRILSMDPNHPEALARYADHFRDKRDWRGLADLAEFAVEAAREAGAGPDELVRRLEELAQVAELRLGDVERAITAWRRIEEIEPGHAKAKEAIRRLLMRAKMWESLVGVLEKEASQATGPRERAEALKRIAQVMRERQVDPRRAIALYEEALSLAPADPASLKALAELYEREGDDAGLARTLRRQLDAQLAAHSDGGRAPSAKEWPTAMRVERIATLRRLASMYDGRLGDVEGVVYACTAILELLPGDRDAMERLEKVLERAGDLERYEQALEYHAAATTGPAERVKVLRKLARLADARGDDVAAADRWEKVLRGSPNDPEALAALAGIYERIGRYAEFAHVAERLLVTRPAPEPGTPQAAARAAELKRYARVADEKLGDAHRAIKAWRQVLEIFPRDREALDALARLYGTRGEWRELADVFGRQIALYVELDRPKAAAIALAQASLFEERLGSPREAEAALERLIREVDPASLEAHGRLRRLYEARGDFEAAVRVAERELYLAEDPAVKCARALEIGQICRDRLGDPRRALHAYERVLVLDPDHPEALEAAAELYARVGDWARHVATLEKLAERAAEGRERRTLYLRIAQAVADRLGQPKEAFAWYRRAHEHAGDATTLAELRRAAEAHGLWRELAEVYEAELERAQASGPAQVVSVCRELAGLFERRLGEPRRALAVLLDAVTASPEDDTLLAEAQRIASEASSQEAWEIYLSILATALERRRPPARPALLLERARVREERLGDAQGALDEMLRAFALAPEREGLREEILRLAEKTKRWNDALAVEAALFLRTPLGEARLAIARRVARFIEERMQDRVRAFRAWLRAFALAPEDPDVNAQLWRLAAAIGPYSEGEQIARPEPAPARIEVEAAVPAEAPRTPVALGSAGSAGSAGAAGAAGAAASLAAASAAMAASAGGAAGVGPTGTGAAHAARSRPAPATRPPPLPRPAAPPAIESEKPPRADATIPLTPADLMTLHTIPAVRRDPTIELQPQDLLSALGPTDTPPSPRSRPPVPPPPGRRPPPPRLPGVHSSPPAPPPKKPPTGEPVRSSAGTATPAPPARRFLSAWEELAYAYEHLPAADEHGRLANLLRAAEVWERGAKDLAKAFETLARALSLAPSSNEPRERLVRLAAAHDEWDRLAALYEEAADRARHATEAAALLREVAEVRLRQKRPLEAEAVYRRILGITPDDLEVRERLEGIFREAGRWVDLAASLEERTDPRLGSGVAHGQRPTLLAELATIYEEKLGNPYEAIAALERLRDLVPDDPAVLERIAGLYSRVGRWAKVSEALLRLADLAEGTPRAREARRRVAEIYEKELELPDRAIEAYQAVVAAWPDDQAAFEALDRLLETHGRWAELSEVLRKRASLAEDPSSRARFLRRRAKVLLDWLDLPDEAVACLRHARTITPDDAALADELVVALSRSGRAREAAAILEGRIQAADRDAGAPGEVAALLLRLAQLRAEALDDREGARKALERVLERVPDHPSALAALARLARGSGDPRAYAEARLREAQATVDTAAKIAALLDAGATLRDRLNDVEGARAAFQAVLELEPANADAVWALSALVAGGGDVDTAVALLERRLAEDLPPDERARTLTELAALARRAGVPAAAELRLSEALAVKPDHLPAIVAKADLLFDLGKHEELEAFLREVLPRLEEAGAPPEVRAELDRRLAAAYEKLGRDDDAYARLLEADKLHRNDLLTKLALGENRYKARRWREAALHLSALAHHPDAPRRAAEVAEGLYHAALAEIRSLRPERAVPLYEAALRLKPDFPLALHALAEVEMERGNVARAAELLEKQAAATPNHAERLRLFEALGDLAVRALRDEARAKTCYEAAVAAAAPLESRHLPLLDKLLGCQRAVGDHVGAGRTCELRASFAADGRGRAVRLREAAEAFLAGGDRARARAAAERAVEADPFDEDAVWLASELELADRDFEAAAGHLGRALMAWDAAAAKARAEGGDPAPLSDAERARRAELWRRLGDARRARGDTRGAVHAYEKAVETDPQADGALAARRALVALFEGDPHKSEAVLAHLRALADAEQRPAEVLLLARALARETRAGPVDEDGGRATLELAAALGEILSDEDRSFLARHPPRVLAADEAYGGALDESDLQALVADPDEQPLRQILRELWEAAPMLWPDAGRALSAMGVVGAERVPPTAKSAATAIYPQVVRALAAPATVLFATGAPGAPDVTLACAAPPIVVIGPRLLSPAAASGREVDLATDAELRFLLGRAVELARPGRIPAAGLPPAEFARLVAGLIKAFGGDRRLLGGVAVDGAAGGAGTLDPADIDAEAERLRRTLPLKVRMKIEPLIESATLDQLDPSRFRAACERAADRAGLIVCGDVNVAMRLVGGPDKGRHLVRLAVKERYLTARAKLGIGAR